MASQILDKVNIQPDSREWGLINKAFEDGLKSAPSDLYPNARKEGGVE